MAPLPVSVIIPACNAAATLPATLDSLRQQTSPHWEAIVVENGSTDTTAAVAAEYCARDPRIRLHVMAGQGVSLARNAGLELAHHEWVLFLDADDWIAPTHLERMTGVLAADAALDAVHCGWARISPDGVSLWEDCGPDEADLFAKLARTCAFAIHACLSRRRQLLELGGFDPSLRTAEDWDLWLRLARTGARFGRVREVLAFYRARAGSASMNADRLLADSLTVLRRAHAPDPRVPQPHPDYGNGQDQDQLPIARIQNVVWAAALTMGQGEDGLRFLEGLTPAEIGFDPPLYASCLHGAIPTAAGTPLTAWADHYDALAPMLQTFLRRLETLAAKPGLARCTQRHLEKLILETSTRARPFTLGLTQALTVETTQPMAELTAPSGVERVHVQVRWDGTPIGDIELPVFDERIPAAVLADAIAAEHAWTLLGRFFTRSVYPTLQCTRETTGWRVVRGGRVLGRELPGDEQPDWVQVHHQIGWTVFLQEAWGMSDLDPSDFYALPPRDHARFADGTAEAQPWRTFELSDRWRDRLLFTRRAAAVLTVGGSPVVQKTIVRRAGRLTARALRAAFTLEAGFELCRVCVREALLGQPADAGSLRTRLATTARRRRRDRAVKLAGQARLAPHAANAAMDYTNGSSGAVQLWTRRRSASCHTPEVRRGQLPLALRTDVEHLCRTTGEPLVSTDGKGPPTALVHAPDVFWQDPPAQPTKPTTGAVAGQAETDPNFFEDLFAQQADPWRYETPYEQTKYTQTLDLLPQPRFKRALEVACAEGHFTVQLAARVDRLVATDVSRTALERTRQRCAQWRHIEYAPLDLLRDPVPGRYDLVVCSEVLYYTGSLAALHDVTHKLAAAVADGGYLVTAHAHTVVDEPDRPGFTWDVPFGAKVIGEAFAQAPGLRLVRELRTPLYRIQVFQRRGLLRRLAKHAPAERQVLTEQPTPLEPEVAAHVSWGRGASTLADQQTELLPILMYHRVADEGPEALARYRLSRDQFEAQLAYLRSAGYTSATLDEWRRAMQAKRPLPGRRVLLTFDDGYRDFLQNAWPLLKKYGFEATVFLPTDLIGRASEWDRAFGEPAPLMTWDEILQLDREGVQFGAHTVSHPLLTSLSPDALAAELLRSRAVLQEYLGERVVSVAYPFGDHDAVVCTVAATCGYVYGLTCEDRPCRLDDLLLMLPRLEVKGSMNLAQFRRLLGEKPANAPMPIGAAPLAEVRV